MIKYILQKIAQRIGYDIYRYPEACERLMPHLHMLLPARCIDTVIDVGANVGQFAAQVRSLSRDVHIHSIEPNPIVYTKLAARAAGDNRWATHECALGRTTGKESLNVFFLKRFQFLPSSK